MSIKDLFEGLFEGLKDSVKTVNADFREMKDGIKNDFDELVSDLTGKEVRHDSTQYGDVRSDTAQYGDVICVKKPGYYHFGVYINDGRVIHFAPRGEFDSLPDAMKNAVIHETTLKKFLGSGHQLFVCDFTKNYSEPSKRRVKYTLPTESVIGDRYGDILRPVKEFQYKLYSPSETVERALSKMGQTKYNLALNNCEHFAIWCKTGIKESHQVNKLLDIVLPAPTY